MMGATTGLLEGFAVERQQVGGPWRSPGDNDLRTTHT